MRTPRQRKQKTSEVSFLGQTNQRRPWSHRQLKHRKWPPKNKAPRQRRGSVARCFPECPSQEGVRLSRTCNSELCMKSAKTENQVFTNFFTILHTVSVTVWKNITTMQKTCQPSCRLTGTNRCFMKKCQRHPLRISHPVVTLAVSMILFNDKPNKASWAGETKTRTSRSQCGAEVVALEKQLYAALSKSPKKRGPQLRSVGFLFCPRG